jgi:polyribonucleotide 5'-hydroxyl-kinase
MAEFAVTVIVVLGHERLYNDMLRQQKGKSNISVVKLARSGGAVEVDESYVQQRQNYVTKQYFYGESKTILSPVSRTLDFKNIKVFRIAESMFFYFIIINLTNYLGRAIQASALPIGQEPLSNISEIEIVQLQSPVVLQHSILAITSVGIGEDPKEALESNVLGFIFV